MAHRNMGDWKVGVQHTKRVKKTVDGHSYEDWEPAPTTFHRVRVEIDLDAIASRLGTYAVNSKAKRSKYLDGAVIVTAMSEILESKVAKR